LNAFMQNDPVIETTLPWLEDAVKLGEQPAAAGCVLCAIRVLNNSRAQASDTRWEGWQHTSLRPLCSVFHYSVNAVKFDVKKLPSPLLADSSRIIVVNGQYHRSSAPSRGVTVIASWMLCTDRGD